MKNKPKQTQFPAASRRLYAGGSKLLTPPSAQPIGFSSFIRYNQAFAQIMIEPNRQHNNRIDIRDCGTAGYRQILQLQKKLHDQRKAGSIADTVLLVEHNPVITLGARQAANKLLADRSALRQKGIDVVDIRRGGGATAHNPGQLVFYPILHLGRLKLGITEYIRTLEQIGMELLDQLGLTAQRKKGLPGLWVGKRKIASIGVRVSRQVTYHGMAVNINNDLGLFDSIVPCGLDNVIITSVKKETGRTSDIPQVKKHLSKLLVKHFSNHPRPTIHNTQYAIRDTKYEIRLPAWLRRPMPAGEEYDRTAKILSNLGLETICTNANCPNRGECWRRGTATVLILGNICTRNCKFCSVAKGKPKPPDPAEPKRLARLVQKLALKYLVITSVDRDDLLDGGAAHFRDCINEVRSQIPDTKFEILVPDFRSCQKEAIEILSDALPFVFAHNVETVPSLYPIARMGGDYQLSLNLLKLVKKCCNDVPTKSSIMLGLGESDAEVEQVLKDLRNAGCDRITIGQYLKPSKDSLDVVEYITPEKFDCWKDRAAELGFNWVISAPFARSSYLAELDSPG